MCHFARLEVDGRHIRTIGVDQVEPVLRPDHSRPVRLGDLILPFEDPCLEVGPLDDSDLDLSALP